MTATMECQRVPGPRPALHTWRGGLWGEGSWAGLRSLIKEPPSPGVARPFPLLRGWVGGSWAVPRGTREGQTRSYPAAPGVPLCTYL